MIGLHRLGALLVIAAHVWVTALPCAPRGVDPDFAPVAMSTADAEALLGLAQSPAPPTAHHGHGEHGGEHAEGMSAESQPMPCHGHAEAETREAAPFEGRLIFLLPACPCGCDQRTPVAGASTARVGVGVPPDAALEAAEPPPLVPFFAGVAEAPKGELTLPDPIPRPAALV